MWAFVNIGLSGGIVAVILFVCWAINDYRERKGPKDIREAEARYDRAERKARRRSRWHGTDYEEERRKAMKEAFPDSGE